MPAYRSQSLAGQRDELGGALRGAEQDEDGRPRRPEQRPERLGHRGPLLGQHARARVHDRVPAWPVPRGPALARGDRDEQQLGSGDLPRRVVVRVDLQAPLPQPPHPGPQAGQGLGPAALAQLGGAGDDVGFEDPPAPWPVGPHRLGPHPLQQVGGAFRQIGPAQGGRQRAPERHGQVGVRGLGRNAADAGQFLADRFAVTRGRGCEEIRDPVRPERRLDEHGSYRVRGQPFGVGGAVGGEPFAFTRMRRGSPVQDDQAGGGLGQGREHEPALRQRVRADPPPARCFASPRNNNARPGRSLRLRSCVPTASYSGHRSSRRCS